LTSAEQANVKIVNDFCAAWTSRDASKIPRFFAEYVLQAVVDDGSLLTGTYCCWVNTEVRVTVK